MLSADELVQTWHEHLGLGPDDPPVMGLRLLELAEDRIVATALLGDDWARPGALVAGPSQFGLADLMGWLACAAHQPVGSDALTSDAHLQLLRPLPLGVVHATAETLRRSRRRAVVSVTLRAGDADAPPATRCTLAFSLRSVDPG